MLRVLRKAWRAFLGWIERSLTRPYKARARLGSPGPGDQVGKKPELDYAPPSKKLLYATAFCFLALISLSTALLLSIILLGQASNELITSIVALSSTLAGIYIGRKGGDLGGR